MLEPTTEELVPILKEKQINVEIIFKIAWNKPNAQFMHKFHPQLKCNVLNEVL